MRALKATDFNPEDIPSKSSAIDTNLLQAHQFGSFIDNLRQLRGTGDVSVEFLEQLDLSRWARRVGRDPDGDAGSMVTTQDDFRRKARAEILVAREGDL